MLLQPHTFGRALPTASFWRARPNGQAGSGLIGRAKSFAVGRIRAPLPVRPCGRFIPSPSGSKSSRRPEPISASRYPPPPGCFLEKRLQADENKGRACEKRGEKAAKRL